MTNLRLILPLFLLALLAGSLGAQERKTDPDPTTVDGKITRVNQEKRELAVRTDAGRELFFTLDKNASIFQGEKEADWSAVKAGMGARVSFVVRSDMRIASQVRIAAEKDDAKPDEAKDPMTPVSVNVKGKIIDMKSDFSELTLKPFGGDEDLKLLIGDDLKFRLRNNKTAVKDFSKGAEVRAIYVVKDGKNFLTSLGDVNTDPTTTTKTEVTPGAPNETFSGTGKDLVSARIVRIRKDLIIMMTQQGDVIVLMTPDSREPILIDATTKIQVDGKSGRIGDLREGSDAQVTYDLTAGRMRARSIVATAASQGPTGALNSNVTAIQPGAGTAVPGSTAVTPGAYGGNTWPGFLPGYYGGGAAAPFLPGPTVPSGNVTGVVSRIIGTVMFVRSADGREFALATDASTKFFFNGKPATLSNFTVGVNVVVMLQNEGSKMTLLIYGTTTVGGTNPPGTPPGTQPPGTQPPGIQPPGTPPPGTNPPVQKNG